jgi:pimeloyl-ACP methyl ester carboxylesterase
MLPDWNNRKTELIIFLYKWMNFFSMVETIFFELPGNVRLTGTKFGNGSKKILFAPGLCPDDKFYQKFLYELSERGFTVFTFSYRGTGSSGQFDLDQNLLDLEQVAKQLAGEGKIALVGHSLGASLTLKLAKKSPQTISSAYLMAPYFGVSFMPSPMRISYKIVKPIWRFPVLYSIGQAIGLVIAKIKGYRFGTRAFKIIMDIASIKIEMPEVPHVLVAPGRDYMFGKRHYKMRDLNYSEMANGLRHSFNKKDRFLNINGKKPFAQDCLVLLTESIAGFIGQYPNGC